MKNVILLFTLLIYASPSYSETNSLNATPSQDYKFLLVGLKKTINYKLPFGQSNDTVYEIDFGGRSGAFQLFGFLEIYDALDSSNSDRHKTGSPNLFTKIYPRLSIDTVIGKSLKIGPFKEWYISSLIIAGDSALRENFIGFGTDIDTPWLGKISANLMARQVVENFGAKNEGKMDGYLLGINWMKPFYTFSKGSFLAYQGFLEYSFGANELSDEKNFSSSFLENQHGISWNNHPYVVSYSFRYFKNMTYFKDGGIGGNTTGLGHSFFVGWNF